MTNNQSENLSLRGGDRKPLCLVIQRVAGRTADCDRAIFWSEIEKHLNFLIHFSIRVQGLHAGRGTA